MNQKESMPSKNLMEYYQVLIRHKYLFILCLVFFLVLAFWHNSRLTPIYRATCSLIIDKEQTKSPLTGQRTTYESYLSESLTFNTHFEMITSRPVLKEVIKSLKMDSAANEQPNDVVEKIYPFKKYINTFKKNVRLLKSQISFFLWSKVPSQKQPETTTSRIDALIQSLKGVISIEPVEETRLLNLTVTHPDPVLARDIPNAVAQAYIDFNIKNRMQASKNTLNWLTENLYETKKNLEQAEEEFSSYKQNVRLISIEKSQEMIAQKMKEFNDAYIEARNRRLELQAKLEQLKSIMQSTEDIAQFRSLISTPLIDSLYKELINAEVEVTKMSKVYKAKHPKVIQVKTKITDTRKKIQQEINKELSNLKAERSVLLAREKVIQDTINDFENEAMETNKLELQHNILKRNVEMNQKMYESLLAGMKEASLTQTIDVSNIRIIEKARLPKFPIGQNKRRGLLLGVILGLVVGIALSFSLEYFDRSLKTEEDVKSYLGLPVLGIIPWADKKTKIVKTH